MVHEIEHEGRSGRAARARREFSAESMAEAVRMVAKRRALGVSPTQVGRELNVRSDKLRAWARQAPDAGGGLRMAGKSVEQENRRLRREVAVLPQEQAFANKVAADFAKESR